MTTRRNWLQQQLLLTLALAAPRLALADKPDLGKLYGKVKIVSSFPDYKVKVVESFADLHVKRVDSFADKPGLWKIVDSFPDFTVQFVDSFPDFTIKYVDSFPGVQ